MKDIVAIVGSHPRTREEFDFTRDDCDIWVFNEAMSQNWATRADAVFQMHSPIIWKNPTNRNDPKHFGWLTDGNTPPVYMQEQYPEVPNAVRYPLEDVKGMISHSFIAKGGKRFPVVFMTSSIALAFALAIQKGYKKIETYGVELESQTEYFYQRGSYYFWAGVAEGKGVIVEHHNSMFDSPVYGYEGDVTIKYQHFADRLAELESQCNELMQAYENKRVEANTKLGEFVRTGENPQSIPDIFGELIEIGSKFGLVDGARQEIKRYAAKADAMRKATGEFVFSRQEFESAAAGIDNQFRAMVQQITVTTNATQQQFADLAKIKNAGKRKYRAEKQFYKLIDEYVKTNVAASILQGGKDENLRLMDLLDNTIRMAGGSKSYEVMIKEAEKCDVNHA